MTKSKPTRQNKQKQTKKYKRNQTRKNTKKYKLYPNKKHYKVQHGSSTIFITVSYDNIPIKPFQTFSKTEIPETAPKVTLNLDNITKQPNQEFVVIMTDPDAPHGEGNQSQGNHTYTHWIYIYPFPDKNPILKYAPPTPPEGIHRYEFNVYIMDQEQIQEIKNIVNNVANNRSNYYEQMAMKNILKNSRKIDDVSFTFKVSAK